MGERIRKLKKIRIHHEGTNTLLFSLIAILFVAENFFGKDVEG